MKTTYRVSRNYEAEEPGMRWQVLRWRGHVTGSGTTVAFFRTRREAEAMKKRMTRR